jgi:hypothetical protein
MAGSYDRKMARFDEESSNAFFDELERWNYVLKAEKIDPSRPSMKRRGPSP